MRKPAPTATEPSAPRPLTSANGVVSVRGAREHNLKNVDVDIPRDALVVFTGISGSGKSSLAFGTLYAEAQRRYFESVAPYARRLIDQVGGPDFDSIEGLPPAVALQQQRGSSNTRSSVGSVTALSSLVRVLYSRAGNYPAGQPMLYAEDFSPNTPQGACATCHGLGRTYDVTEQLLAHLEMLVDAGNTVIAVEHDMAVVARCDWVIDLGPGGGDDGGQIVCGGPTAIVARHDTRTGTYLRAALPPARRSAGPPAGTAGRASGTAAA